jgi:adenosylmethionine-8-amino-7-oxononanoate aminotransferase
MPAASAGHPAKTALIAVTEALHGRRLGARSASARKEALVEPRDCVAPAGPAER